MDGVNYTNQVTWSHRIRPNTASQIKSGGELGGLNPIALEYQILFANETNKNLYVLVPAKANDDYITKMAQMIKYGSDGVNPYTSTQANPVYRRLQAPSRCTSSTRMKLGTVSFRPPARHANWLMRG
jgi:hypothetical protein